MSAKRLPIRMWRVSRAEPYGLHVWFDPDTEVVKLFDLEPHPKDGVRELREGDDLMPSPARDPSQNELVFHQEDLPF